MNPDINRDLPGALWHRSLQDFFQGKPDRARSPECDYGVHWRLDGYPGTWRVSYVRNTGEVYALNLSPEDGRLAIIATVPPDQPAKPGDTYYRTLNAILHGWADHCGPRNGLAWAADRLAEYPPNKGEPGNWRQAPQSGVSRTNPTPRSHLRRNDGSVESPTMTGYH